MQKGPTLRAIERHRRIANFAMHRDSVGRWSSSWPLVPATRPHAMTLHPMRFGFATMAYVQSTSELDMMPSLPATLRKEIREDDHMRQGAVSRLAI